jgi:hypothetical protein
VGFQTAVVAFMAVHSNHADLPIRLVQDVTDHSTPVSSGTAARTKGIPNEEQAETAVIA